MALTFEWDEAKDLSNQKKHGISFEEAKTVFSDPQSLTIADEAHY
ncbi:MAG: BrnT family toxin [Pirellulales bacterium]